MDISETDQERLVRMFKALGNTKRFEVLKFLVTHPGCITGDIVEFLPIAQATVSQHLIHLKSRGIISSNRKGLEMIYGVTEPWARCIVDMIDKMEKETEILE